MNKLPSAHQVKSKVTYTPRRGVYLKAKVIKVHFTESKVTYDVEYDFEQGAEGSSPARVRAYNVDSVFVLKYGIHEYQS